MGNLAWNLEASHAYVTGEELEAAIEVVAPQDGNYYIIGALYTPELVMITGTFFGLLQSEEPSVVRNDAAFMSYWGLTEGERLELTAKLTLGYTGCVLGLMLYRMVGDEADLSVDAAIDSVSVILTGPFEIDWNTLLGMGMGVVMVAAVAPMVAKV